VSGIPLEQLQKLHLLENITIYNWRVPSDRQVVLERCHSTCKPGDYDSPLLAVAELLDDAGALSVIEEREYIDRGFRSGYSRFYSRLFRRMDDRCVRYHAFDVEVTPKDLLTPSLDSEHYLGYFVLRPTRTFRLGRTFLRLPRKKDRYVLCQVESEVNLAGTQLLASAFPFIQQDTQVFCCASASIWMTTQAMAKRYGCQARSPAEITALATRYHGETGRPMPTEGLSDVQMLDAYAQMGYDPVQRSPDGPAEGKHLVYQFIESEIPANLLISLPGTDYLHANVVVGHSYDHRRTPCTVHYGSHVGGPGIDLLSTSSMVDEFYVNDDARGPYRRLRLLEPEQLAEKVGDPANPDFADPSKLGQPSHLDTKVKLTDFTCPIELFGDASEPPQCFNLDSVIAPLPPRVNITPEVAEDMAALLLMELGPGADLPLERIVVRTYLMPSNHFKVRLASWGIHGYLRALYRTSPLPRLVWITEISYPELIDRPDPADRQMIGEIILDATGDHYDFDYFLFAHLPGQVLMQPPFGRECGVPKRKRLDGDAPYSHLVR